MNKNASLFIIFGLSLIPYALVAWGYKKLTGGDDGDYWIALGVLIAVRMFFSLIESLGGILTWRVYGKGLAIQTFYDFLRDNEFPKRIYAHDNIDNYLARVMSDTKFSMKARLSAAALEASLACHHGTGMLPGMRMQEAAEAALERLSPRAHAPVMT